ncbi:MAG: hypothetical protein PVH30_08120 [Desulfobacterales bacterium]|jgi:hypothetical protein
MKKNPSSPFQGCLGAAYVAAGTGVLVFLPRRMGEIAEATNRDPASLDMLFQWFSFGLIGVLLIGGGVKKIMAWHRARHNKS